MREPSIADRCCVATKALTRRRAGTSGRRTTCTACGSRATGGATTCIVELISGTVARVHLRTGSYANWPVLAHATAGNPLPYFPPGHCSPPTGRCPNHDSFAALGDCALGCNVLGHAAELASPLDRHLPIDIWIPGCPPTPASIAQHLLAALAPIS
jgi:hypothetical protein